MTLPTRAICRPNFAANHGHWRQPTTDRQRRPPTTYPFSLLPAAYYLLPAVYCLLPTTHYPVLPLHQRSVTELIPTPIYIQNLL